MEIREHAQAILDAIDAGQKAALPGIDGSKNQHDPALKHAVAERQHEEHRKFITLASEATIQDGRGSMKALLIINGGAAIAILAFLGSSFGLEASKLVELLPEIAFSLLVFGFGVALAAAGACFVYLAHHSYTASAMNAVFTYEEPFIEQTSASKWWLVSGTVCKFISMLLAAAALFSFLFGMFAFRNAILAFANA